MKETGRHMFFEVEDAASILGEKVGRVIGWLEGGRIRGTFVRDRWLAETSDVLRLHAETSAHRRVSLPTIHSGDGRCARIAELNRRMHTDGRSPRLAKIERNLSALLEDLCIVAPYGMRPPPVRKKTARERLESKQRVEARIRADEKKKAQRDNARSYRDFCRLRGDQISNPGRSISDERFWWNEE